MLMTSLTGPAPKRDDAHAQGEDEHDRTKGREEQTSVWRVCFSNRSENLGLGEVACSGEQHVERVGLLKELKQPNHGHEHHGGSRQGTEHEEPRLVAETGGHVRDGHRETEHEEQGLQSGAAEDEVHAWVGVEGHREKQRGPQHRQHEHAQRRAVLVPEHVGGHDVHVAHEQNRWCHDESLPAERHNAEGNAGQCSVCNGKAAMGCHVAKGAKHAVGAGVGGAGQAFIAACGHGAKEPHEAERHEEHHEGVVVRVGPRRA